MNRLASVRTHKLLRLNLLVNWGVMLLARFLLDILHEERGAQVLLALCLDVLVAQPMLVRLLKLVVIGELLALLLMGRFMRLLRNYKELRVVRSWENLIIILGLAHNSVQVLEPLLTGVLLGEQLQIHVLHGVLNEAINGLVLSFLLHRRVLPRCRSRGWLLSDEALLRPC
mmetsp:Transcript_34725/g.53298  ORF Transcript_34725/g.53298 Transcript_34725/m.53298 type:complete len:171 (+) Transcript_34725:1857-2369(+)